MCGATRVHDDLLLAACKWQNRNFYLKHLYCLLCSLTFLFFTAEGLASQVTDENFAKGIIYPPYSCIRTISAHIAASVAAKAYELGNFFLYFHFLLHLLQKIVTI